MGRQEDGQPAGLSQQQGLGDGGPNPVQHLLTRRRGFSLIELIVSIAILAIALLTLLSLLTSGLRTSQKSENLATAAAVAQRELDRAIYAALSDEPPGSRKQFWDQEFPYDSASWLEGTTRVGTTDYNFSIYAETVNDVTTGAPLGALTDQDRVKRVQAVVWWFAGSAGDRQGYGKLVTHSSRLVNQVPEAP